MDPDKALETLTALLPMTITDKEARREANEKIDDLRKWLFQGGFEPNWDNFPEAGHIVRSGGYFLV